MSKAKQRAISRRTFTRLVLTGAIGSTLAFAEVASRPLGLLKWLDVNLRRVGKSFGEPSKIAIVNAPSYEVDLLAPLRSAWDLTNSPNVAGKKVLLKPSIIYNLAEREVNTHPAVIEAAIQLMQEKGAREVIVADGVSYHCDPLDLLFASGIGPMLEAYNVRWVDLNHDDMVKVPTKGGYTSRETLWLPKTIAEAEVIISMPKLKTDYWAGTSLSMKNLYGTLPGVRYGWPKGNQYINGIDINMVELYETIAPQVAIVDGIIGMEDDGPLFGRNRLSQILIVGSDLVAVDATCARIMSFEPTKDRLAHIWYAEWLGLGRLNQERIKIVGTPINSVRQNYTAPRSTELNK